MAYICFIQEENTQKNGPYSFRKERMPAVDTCSKAMEGFTANYSLISRMKFGRILIEMHSEFCHMLKVQTVIRKPIFFEIGFQRFSAVRCFLASYKNTALALATFSESVPFIIGIATKSVQTSRMACEIPSPSFPKTIQTFPDTLIE